MSEDLHGPLFAVGQYVYINDISDETPRKITGWAHIESVGNAYQIDGIKDAYISEDMLTPVDEADEDEDMPVIDFEIRFTFGDIVRINMPGFESIEYRVLGFRSESWHYPDEEWAEVIYELSRIDTGEWAEASDEELILVKEAEEGQEAHTDVGLATENKNTEAVGMAKDPKLAKAVAKKEKRDNIDNWLDIMNWNAKKYAETGDESYEEKRKEAMAKVSELVSEGE